MNRTHKRFYRLTWVIIILLGFVPTAVSGAGKGLAAEVCLNLGLLIALTMAPPELIIEAMETKILGYNDNNG